jgi:hypothetical protein
MGFEIEISGEGIARIERSETRIRSGITFQIEAQETHAKRSDERLRGNPKIRNQNSNSEKNTVK